MVSGACRDAGSAVGDAPSGHVGAGIYLALLQDRLPVYVHSLSAATGQAGYGSVEGNLSQAARATIDFHRTILPVKVSVLAVPAELVELRHAMKARGLGPGRAEDAVSWYLREEQQLGRIAADADPRASACLLLGACLSYSFTAMLLGHESVPPLDEYVPDVVQGLRLA